MKKDKEFYGNCVLWKKNGEEKRRKKIVIDPIYNDIVAKADRYATELKHL